MSMMVFYPQIKTVHIAAVVCSGSLFFLRGALVQAGRSAWAMVAPLRYLSYGIDTVLLTAALMLLTILPGAVFANGWLATKLPEWAELLFGIPAILLAYGAVIWRKGFGPEDRVLFRKHPA